MPIDYNRLLAHYNRKGISNENLPAEKSRLTESSEINDSSLRPPSDGSHESSQLKLQCRTSTVENVAAPFSFYQALAHKSN